MKKILLMTILFLPAYTFGENNYSYCDIQECVIPIKNDLELIEPYNYAERNWVEMYRNPISLTVEEKNKKTITVANEIIDNMHLNHVYIRNKYQRVHTGNNKEDTFSLIVLKKHIILTVNYKKDEIDYLLSYCNSTQK